MNGHFLQCFKHCLPSWTEEHGLDVDSEDCLYLAEVNGNVKINSIHETFTTRINAVKTSIEGQELYGCL